MKEKMTYILLAAGKGTGLQPLTFTYPKTSYKLDDNTTVLQRMVRKIREYDNNAEIIVALGYLANTNKRELIDDNVKFVINPFYETTGSIATLWFARNYLERENVVIINGDMVFSDEIIKEIIVKPTKYPYVCVDSSLKQDGKYNVSIKDDKVLVMSNKLQHYDAKYCNVTKLDPVSSRIVKEEIDEMIYNNMYKQYFEDSLVQMIMFNDFNLRYVDIKKYMWSEINSVDDLIEAQEIHNNK